MSEYMGNRRAAAPLSAAQTQNAFAEDDEALTCPQCGSSVRPDHDWCSLCLHILRAPEPEPVPEPAPVEPPADQRVAVPTSAPVAVAVPVANDEPSALGVPGRSASPLAPEVEAAAQALLEQLAAESRRTGLNVPELLANRGRVAVAVVVGMAVLTGGILLLLTIAGAILH